MNVYLRELKGNLKVLIFWIFGIMVFGILGMVKFDGFSGSDNSGVMDMINSFPKIFLAMFGMNGVDISSVSGYYAVIGNYFLLAGVVYAINLGINCESKEIVGKTYEFLFTKPVSRSKILLNKVLAGITYLVIFCLVVYISSILGLMTYNIKNTIGLEIVLFTIMIFIVQLVFFMMSIFISSVVNKKKNGSKMAYLVFLGMYLLGVIYDITENGWYIQIFTPLKYFLSSELIDGYFNIIYLFVCLGLVVVFGYGAFYYFNKKDLKAI